MCYSKDIHNSRTLVRGLYTLITGLFKKWPYFQTHKVVAHEGGGALLGIAGWVEQLTQASRAGGQAGAGHVGGAEAGGPL